MTCASTVDEPHYLIKVTDVPSRSYWDGVGGETLDLALANARRYARFIVRPSSLPSPLYPPYSYPSQPLFPSLADPILLLLLLIFFFLSLFFPLSFINSSSLDPLLCFISRPPLPKDSITRFV